MILALKMQNMTQKDLSMKSGVSASFISDIAKGEGNPSLHNMERISMALNIPLPLLLEKKCILFMGNAPEGYEKVIAILPHHKAFIVKKWQQEVQNKRKRS